MKLQIQDLVTEMLVGRDGTAGALAVSDSLGNKYGYIQWSWDSGVLAASAGKLPDYYEGKVLGPDDMVTQEFTIQGGLMLSRTSQAEYMANRIMDWGIVVEPLQEEVPAPVDVGVDLAAEGSDKTAVSKFSFASHYGTVAGEIDASGAVLQVNVYEAGEGYQPPMFLVFSDKDTEKALKAVKELVEGEPLPPDTNITSAVPGALAAGTGSRIRDVKFGTPTVSHADAAK